MLPSTDVCAKIAYATFNGNSMTTGALALMQDAIILDCLTDAEDLCTTLLI